VVEEGEWSGTKFELGRGAPVVRSKSDAIGSLKTNDMAGSRLPSFSTVECLALAHWLLASSWTNSRRTRMLLRFCGCRQRAERGR
jgi:hypothetical protein